MSQGKALSISEPAKLGLRARAKEGKWNGGRVPFGYKYNGNGRLEVYTREAKIVKFIFERYIEHRFMNSVVYDLNKKFIPTRNGNKWSVSSIGYILMNEIYIGKFTQCGITQINERLRIIDDKTFKKVQKIRTHVRKYYPKYKSEFI